MFKFSSFTPKANDAINLAMAQASLLGHTYIGSEHILLGLLLEGSGVAYNILSYKKVTADQVLSLLIKSVGKGVKSKLQPSDLSPRGKRILENAILEARGLGNDQTGTEHILIAILKEKDCYGIKFLKELGVDLEQVEKLLQEPAASFWDEGLYRSQGSIRQRTQQKEKSCPMLKRFGKDLTQQAQKGRLDPVFNRDEEISRVMQILLRRSKNNPCLIGEAGVGKTAIVEGLAQRIITGEVPDNLRDKKIITVDIVSMLAGTKYRGEFEERVKTAINEACERNDVILFIDEMHTIVGAGAAEGAIDASNIFKPQLARGEIQIIGATTTDEYRRHIEKDSALERRFQSVMIKEPSVDDTLEILKGLREKYEKHHKLDITDKALESAVKLAERYIPDRFFPDKAIDLIDEAASKARLKVRVKPEQIKVLESKKEELIERKEAALTSQDYELAAVIAREEKETTQKLYTAMRKWRMEELISTKSITEENVAQVVAGMTGIEVTSITDEESKRLINMEKELSKRVVGQQEAVEAVSKAIRRGRVGLKDPQRPVGSFLFLGPTGVGKTELCKALAELLFSTQDSLITFDMSEYMDKNSSTKLIGSPPGYVGFEDGGQLTEKIRRRPYSVVLFDEIEKADPDVYNMFLQILDEGILSDSHGKKVSFKNCVIIMTSNVGARFITEHKYMGFAKDDTVVENHARKEVMSELRKTFRPEFINRIDEIVLFNKLGKAEIEGISQRLLEDVQKRMRDLDIGFEYSKQVVEAVAKNGCDLAFGARPLRRYIQNNVEDKLAELILTGKAEKNKFVRCDFEEDYSFTIGDSDEKIEI